MRFIGKIDGLPLFEFEEGMYVAVDSENRKVYPMWCWFASLGKWNDEFMKCGSCEDEQECLDVIQENKSIIKDAFNSYVDDLESEDAKEFLEEQEKFYNWLESDRVYNWFDGYEDEESEKDE